MADVFVSYSREDKARAAEVVRLLEDYGWDVFWDQETRAGEMWPKVLEEELGKARCLVALWTKTSIASRWVRIEAYEALQNDKLVPVLLDKVRPPLEFRQTQTFDLSGWEGSRDDPRLSQLLMDLTVVAKAPTAVHNKPSSLQLVVPSTLRRELRATEEDTIGTDAAADARPAVASAAEADVGQRSPTDRAGLAITSSRGLMVGLGVIVVGAAAWLIASMEPAPTAVQKTTPMSEAMREPPSVQSTPYDSAPNKAPPNKPPPNNAPPENPSPVKKIVVADPAPPKPARSTAKLTQRPARCATIEEKFQQTGQLTAAEQSVLRSKECQ